MSSMHKIGRPQGNWLKYVDIEEEQNGEKTVTCRTAGCNKIRKVGTGRKLSASKWYEHLICDCSELPFADKKKLSFECRTKKVLDWKREWKDKEEAQAMEEVDNLEEEEEEFLATKKRMRQSSLLEERNYATFDSCDAARAKVINEQVTRFVVGCGVPFNIINSKFFRDMCKSMNGAYHKQMPKANAFRITHLPKLYNTTVEDIKEMWKKQGDPPRTFGFDGFTSKGDGTQVIN
jgi:hypothetical protein